MLTLPCSLFFFFLPALSGMLCLELCTIMPNEFHGRIRKLLQIKVGDKEWRKRGEMRMLQLRSVGKAKKIVKESLCYTILLYISAKDDLSLLI